MNFFKYVKIIGVMILLASCNNSEKINIEPERLFKAELKNVYSAYETTDKILIDNISNEKIKRIIDRVLENIEYSDLEIICADVDEGVVRNDGQRVMVLKLPTQIKLKANEKNIKEILNKVVKLDEKIVVDDISIIKSENVYELNCIISFCGKLNEKTEKNESPKITLEEVSGNKSETNRIILRNSNLLMILRPYNSDSATLTLGLTDDKSGNSYVYYDINKKVNLGIDFYKENNKYYCEYKNIDGNMLKSEINIKDDKIMFDVLSCANTASEDLLKVELKLVNKTDKVVDVKIFDDVNDRVSIIKNGNVEVSD